jgi:large subunit ribosomal protein L18
MHDANQVRLRRARRTRAKIAELKAARLCVYRTNGHMYAQIIGGEGGKILASASTVEQELRKELPNGGNIKAASLVGRRIAEKAKALGIEKVAFDRSGYQYHGRIKALAEAAREHGLAF